MEHEVWQIRQQDVLAEPPLSNANNDDAMDNVHLPNSATAEYHGRVLFDQLVGDAPKDESGSSSHVTDASQGMCAKLSENTTFFVNMTPTLSEKDYKRFVRSQAMKAYHAKRRRKAALEDEAQPAALMSLDYGRIVNRYTQDPFVSFPVEMAPTTREFLHNGESCRAFQSMLSNRKTC